jgi:hypothetical protein
MYHPFAIEQVRIQEQLRRRAEADHWQREAIESRPARLWRPAARRRLLRLAFTDTAMRPMPPVCVDC